MVLFGLWKNKGEKMCNVFRVAKEICKKNDWQITNLQLQKILYITEVFSLGILGKTIFNSKIEAWDYGPVVPEVYHKFKYFVDTPIPEFAFPRDIEQCDSDECKFIDEMVELTKGLKGWELVAITHRQGTAWSNTYQEGIKFLEISDDNMRAEYKNLWGRKNNE